MVERIKPYLGDKAFYQAVAKITLPISAQSLITIGINITATLMVGTLGEVQLSAASLANQFFILFFICNMGIGQGASVFASRFWGMRDIGQLKKAMTIMFRICFAFSVMFTVIAAIFPEGVMRIYTPDDAVVAYGVKYLRWMVPCFFLTSFPLMCTTILRCKRQVKLPLICSIFSFVTNIFLSWMLIFGNLGAPRMELEGAAIATLASRCIEFTVICGYLFLKEKTIGYRVRDLWMNCKDLVRDYFRISIPVLVSDALLGLGGSMVSMVLGRLGPSYVSANAITIVTQQLSTVFIQGASNAGAVITGNTIGEGLIDRAQKQGVTFAGLGALIGVFAGALIFVIKDPVIALYDLSAETQAITSQLMSVMAVIVIFQSLETILTKGVLRAGGDTRFLMVADVLFLWVVSIPLGALAGLVWHLPAYAVYLCLRFDHIIKAGWCLSRLKSGKWLKHF